MQAAQVHERALRPALSVGLAGWLSPPLGAVSLPLTPWESGDPYSSVTPSPSLRLPTLAHPHFQSFLELTSWPPT